MKNEMIRQISKIYLTLAGVLFISLNAKADEPYAITTESSCPSELLAVLSNQQTTNISFECSADNTEEALPLLQKYLPKLVTHILDEMKIHNMSVDTIVFADYNARDTSSFTVNPFEVEYDHDTGKMTLVISVVNEEWLWGRYSPEATEADLRMWATFQHPYNKAVTPAMLKEYLASNLQKAISVSLSTPHLDGQNDDLFNN